VISCLASTICRQDSTRCEAPSRCPCTAKPLPAASSPASLRASVVRIRRPAPTVHVMRNVGRSVALRASAGLFVVMVGCGAAVVGAGASAPTPDTTATNAMSSAAPAPPPAPGGPTGGGGALPVRPATGGCIIGLNCGCISRLCPGPQPHHPGITNGQPNYAPVTPRPGGGG
jgi:hypothetical protein